MDICRVCGLTYKECKYPISHSHATVNNIDPYNGRNDFHFSDLDEAYLNELHNRRTNANYR